MTVSASRVHDDDLLVMDADGGASRDFDVGGGGNFAPFTARTPIPVKPWDVVTNSIGQKFVVVGSGGTDANGVAVWNAVPLQDFRVAMGQAALQAAAAAAVASMAELRVSVGQAVLTAAGSAGTAIVLTAAIAATGPVGAAIGVALTVSGGFELVGTFSDMNRDPANYTQQNVVDLGAGVIGAMGGSMLGMARSPSQIDRAAFRAERQTYWKTEAKNKPGNYSAANLTRMQEGKPPIGSDSYPMELHHNNQTPNGGLTPMTRTDHRLGGNYGINHPGPPPPPGGGG